MRKSARSLQYGRNSAIGGWIKEHGGLVARSLFLDESIDFIGPELIQEALTEKNWTLTSQDTKGDINALMALMSSRLGVLDDIATKGATGYYPKTPMSEGEQKIASTLVFLGCNPLISHEYTGGCDSLDMALNRGAATFLDEQIQGMKWQDRIIDDVPWIHAAARAGLTDVLSVLLKHGGDVNQLDAEGNTPLFWAGNADTINILLENGANKDHINNNGSNAKAFWIGKRGVAGERLNEMVAAIGKISIPSSEDERIRTFLNLSENGATGILQKEARTLGIKGHEVVDGRSIVGTAAQRIIRSANDRNANSWLLAVSKWKAAMGAASEEDLIMMQMAGACWGLAIMESATIELEKRGLEQESLLDLRFEVYRSLKKMRDPVFFGQSGMEVVKYMTQIPGFISKHADTFISCVEDTQYNHFKSENKLEITEAILAEGAGEGWKAQGLLEMLINIVNSDNMLVFQPKLVDEQNMVTQKATESVVLALEHGAVISEQLDEMIESKIKLQQNSTKIDCLKEIRVELTQARLDRSTLPAKKVMPGKPARL